MEPNRWRTWWSRCGQTAEVAFLCVGPVVFPLSWWPGLLGRLYPLAAVLYWLLYARALVNTTCRKLLPSHRKGHRSFTGAVDEEDLHRLAGYCRDEVNVPHADQISYFALSVLAKRTVRRRVTDEFIPSRRTVTKSVSVEVDLNHNMLPWVRPPRRSKPAPPNQLYVALTTIQKGVLYDNLVVRDGNGNVLPSLSHREFRLLAAMTLRSLFRAAFPARLPLPDEALAAERAGLAEILRFARTEQSDETPHQYRERRRNGVDGLRELANAIVALPGNRAFLELAAELVWQLSQSYVLVAVVPGGRDSGGRFIMRYDRTLLPHLRVGRALGVRGLKDRMRLFLGARPVFLSVNARNAGTCQSYHLLITGPPELYVGDFDIRPVVEAAEAGGKGHGGGQVDSYWRVRGRRGQQYFHLYTRALHLRNQNPLLVNVKFFEVPPGSLARAGAAAVATFIATAAVAFAVSRTDDLQDIDGQLAVFLLAAPGIAAAWLGFESRPGLLLDGTLATRMSTVVTFLLAMAGSVVLLLNRAEVYPLRQEQLFVGLRWDLGWTLIVAGAFVNMMVTCYAWWQRTTHYQRIATRSTDDWSAMPND